MVTSGCCVGFPARRISCLRGPGRLLAASGVSCTSLTGKVNTTTDSAKVTTSKCNDLPNTGGKGTTTELRGRTLFDDHVGRRERNHDSRPGDHQRWFAAPCPGSDLEEMTSATVTGGTGAAKKSIKKGWTSQSYVCYNPTTNKLSLHRVPPTRSVRVSDPDLLVTFVRWRLPGAPEMKH